LELEQTTWGSKVNIKIKLQNFFYKKKKKKAYSLMNNNISRIICTTNQIKEKHLNV